MIHDPARAVIQEIAVETVPLADGLDALTSRELPSSRENPLVGGAATPPFVPF